MRKSMLAAGLAAAVATLPAAVVADDEANIKYRQSIMKAIAGHAGATASLAKGAVPHSGHLAAHASAIGELAPMVTAAFRERTNVGEDTDATAKVWDDWAEFEEKAKALEMAAADLASTVAGGGAAGPKLKPLFDACKGCHEAFRKE